MQSKKKLITKYYTNQTLESGVSFSTVRTQQIMYDVIYRSHFFI